MFVLQDSWKLVSCAHFEQYLSNIIVQDLDGEKDKLFYQQPAVFPVKCYTSNINQSEVITHLLTIIFSMISK